MPDVEYSYTWRGSARTPGRVQQQAGAAPGSASATTPSRSTRRSGFLNLTHYNAFTRSDGDVFQVGDVVQVWDGTEFAPAQVWLDPYKSLGVQSAQSARREEEQQRRASTTASTSASTGSPSRKTSAAGAASLRAKRAGKHHAALVQREQEQVELIDDGLDDSVKFGIIIDLFEDEEENMRVAIHWLARPRLLCLLFGNDGAREEGLDESHPKELIYAFDPAEDSRKSKTTKGSRAEDIHDVSYILSRIRITSQDEFLALETNKGKERALDPVQEPTFFVRKAMNAKAEQGEGWFYDVAWQDVYERAMTSGNWELSVGTVAVSSDDEEDRRKRSKTARSSKKATSTRTARSTAAKKVAPGSAVRKKVIKRVVQDIEKDLPKLPSVRAASASTSRRSSRASSVDTEMLEEKSVLDDDEDEMEESSEEEDEDGEDIYEASRHSDEENISDDEEAEMDLGEPSSDEADYKEADEKEDDVFGSRTASGRKRKVAGKGKASPTKRSRGTGSGALVLRPSAATVRKAAARAARQAQRLAERQARRLKPRLAFAQQRQLGREKDAMSPFERARAVLHVGCTPDYLPCRDEEYAEIEAYLEDAIDEGVGSCIYIAGVPGTGKTATVRSVISSLQQRASDSEIKKFRFLEVNGMKITDPAQSFSILWEFISGNRTSPKVALNNLETHFKTPDPGRDTCVILVDELDQLVTKRQEVIYNFFNWPNQAHSRLIVLAIANTMDLPERELSNKITSRLGSNRINFTPYDKNQLIEILTTRMEGFGDTVFAKDAIGLVAGKVAGVTGDARRALDICRRAVEKVEQENTARRLATFASESGTSVAQTHKDRLVTAADIVVVHREMTSSGLMLFVKRAGLHQRIMLLALSRAIRKVGVADEAEFGDVIRWHLDFCRQTALSPLPTHAQLFSILQSLADMKLVTTEGARLDRFQRVQANVRDDELELVLRKEGRFMHYLR